MPTATKRPTTVAPIPVTPRAPLPLKATVGEFESEVLVDVPTEDLGIVELIPVERELPEPRKVSGV